MTCLCGDTDCPSCGSAQGTLPCQHPNTRQLYIRGPRSAGSPMKPDARRCLDCRHLLELQGSQEP